MSLRISGGTLKGRIIAVPKIQQVRPTSERVREAIFSKIYHDLLDSTFLDICSGSGVMAIEAFSRGASLVTSVEQNRKCISVIRNNFQKCNVPPEQFQVLMGDATKISLPSTDILFLDPPYAHSSELWIPALEEKVQKMMIFEHSARFDLPDQTKCLIKLDERKYGDSKITFFVPQQLP